MNWETLTDEQIEERRFRQQLLRSQLAVDAVAEHYRQRGLAVTVPELRIRPTIAERKDYGDHGDLFVGFPRQPQQRLEVKWRRLDFTSAEEFPYRNMNIDRVDKRDGLAHLYLQVNYNRTHVACIRASTRSQWSIATVDEPKRGYSNYRIYRCPKHIARFFALLKKPTLSPAPWRGRCDVCGQPGMYFQMGKWLCEDHRFW